MPEHAAVVMLSRQGDTRGSDLVVGELDGPRRWVGTPHWDMVALTGEDGVL
jgi:hypothetical protein